MKNNHASQRSLKYLKDKMGMSAGVVERLIPRPGSFPVRKDYLGFIDIIAVGGGRVLGVQCTTPKQIKPHIKKIMSEDLREDLVRWIESADLEVWAWEPRAREPTVEVVTPAEIETLGKPEND